jgi:hypothetical protein
MTEFDLARLYEPVGSITFAEFVEILDQIEKSIDQDDRSAELKTANKVLLAAVRSNVSSHVAANSPQDM